MSKEISIKLNSNSIQDAINYLTRYRDSLKSKNELFMKRLGDLGYAIAKYYTESALGDSDDVSCAMQFESGSDRCVVRINLNGKDAFFVEFGSGITYNPSNLGADNPLGEGKYGVGTYPGQKHAYNSKGWWYTDEDGKSRHSYGTEATMPLYRAQTEIMASVLSVAKEVFGNGTI